MGQEDSEEKIFGAWVYIPQSLLLCFTIYSFIAPEKFWGEFPAIVFGSGVSDYQFCFCLIPAALLFSLVPNNAIDQRIPIAFALFLVIVTSLTISIIDYWWGFGNFVKWTCAIIVALAILAILPANGVQNGGGGSMFQAPEIVPAGGILCHNCGKGTIIGYRYSGCNSQLCDRCGHGGHCKRCNVVGCWGEPIEWA